MLLLLLLLARFSRLVLGGCWIFHILILTQHDFSPQLFTLLYLYLFTDFIQGSASPTITYLSKKYACRSFAPIRRI
jgi:hypothetical protein